MSNKNLLILKIIAVTTFVVSYFVPLCLNSTLDNNTGWRMALALSTPLFEGEAFAFPFFLVFLPNILGIISIPLLFIRYKTIFFVFSVLVLMSTVYWMCFSLQGDELFIGTILWMLGSGTMTFCFYESKMLEKKNR